MARPKLKKRVKAQWLAALRSGDYGQGRGALRKRAANGDKFCCLGVLCELAVKAGVIGAGSPHYPNDTYSYGEYADSAVLPREVQEWAFTRASQDDDANLYNPFAGGHALAEWNDGMVAPETDFNGIADLIEAHL